MKRLVLSIGVLLLAATVPVLAQDDNLKKGKDAYKNKQYADAISLLAAEVAKSPDSKEAQYYLGMAFWNSGNPDSALVHLERAYARDSKNPEYAYSLGTLYLEKHMPADAKRVFEAGLAVGKKGYKARFYYGMGRADIEADSLNSAIVNLMHAREADSKDKNVYIALGDAYAAQKVSTVAIDNYRQALALDSTLIDIRYTIANLLYQDRQFNEALAEYRKIVEISPGYRDSYSQIATLYFFAERYPEAIQYGEDAVRVDSADVDLMRLVARAYVKTGDRPKVIEAYERLAKWTDLTAAEYVELGRSYQVLKDNPQAITSLEKAVAIDSTLDLHFDIGTLLYVEQRYPEAIGHFEKKVEQDPQSGSAFLNLGISYMRLQKYREAVAALRKGVDLKPDQLQGHLWLAQSYATLDSLDQAAAEYRVVAKMDSTNAESRRYIGLANLLKKNYAPAISYLLEATSLDPGAMQGHLWLAQAYLLNHQGDKALVEYRRVLQIDPNNKEAQKRVKILE
jgi:tetratricopeptide (TPR) repeat protein